jgi:GNAT superfamily N-acetyltransferase
VSISVRTMVSDDIPGVVGLQRICFPEPFPVELLWSQSHLAEHLRIFPEGQLVAVFDGVIAASASSTRILDARFESHLSWEDTVGGPFLGTFDSTGGTLYGLDISVDPRFRRLGIGRLLYEARFKLVVELGMTRFGTGCRLPDYRDSGLAGKLEEYLISVQSGRHVDRTLTPLLRYGLTLLGGIENYMEDPESMDCAALLEWVA